MVANPQKMLHEPGAASVARAGSVDWRAVVRHVAVSRALDDLEESTLVPERKVLYQFSARGHDVTQVLLGYAHRRAGWGRRLLSFAPPAARTGLVARGSPRLDHDARRRH